MCITICDGHNILSVRFTRCDGDNINYVLQDVIGTIFSMFHKMWRTQYKVYFTRYDEQNKKYVSQDMMNTI